MQGNHIIYSAVPSSNDDVVNKYFVDNSLLNYLKTVDANTNYLKIVDFNSNMVEGKGKNIVEKLGYQMSYPDMPTFMMNAYDTFG